MTVLPTRFPLRHPIHRPSGKRITEIPLRRPLAEDFLALDKLKDKTAVAIKLIARMSGIPEPMLRKLDGEDFGAICNLIGAER